MSFKVLLHPKAARFLEKLDTSLKERIRQSLRELEDSPEKRVNVSSIRNSGGLESGTTV